MPRYKVFRLRNSQVEKFRDRSPAPKPYQLKTGDYQEGGEVEAASPYAAWKQLQDRDDDPERRFGVGDVLASESASPLVLNYWGFDEAGWRTSGQEQTGADTEHLAVGAAVAGSLAAADRGPAEHAPADR